MADSRHVSFLYQRRCAPMFGLVFAVSLDKRPFDIFRNVPNGQAGFPMSRKIKAETISRGLDSSKRLVTLTTATAQRGAPHATKALKLMQIPHHVTKSGLKKLAENLNFNFIPTDATLNLALLTGIEHSVG